MRITERIKLMNENTKRIESLEEELHELRKAITYLLNKIEEGKQI